MLIKQLAVEPLRQLAGSNIRAYPKE